MIVYDGLYTQLKKQGMTLTELKKKKLLSGSVVTVLEQSGSVTVTTLDRLCALLDCQPGDLISYVKGQE